MHCGPKELTRSPRHYLTRYHEIPDSTAAHLHGRRNNGCSVELERRPGNADFANARLVQTLCTTTTTTTTATPATTFRAEILSSHRDATSHHVARTIVTNKYENERTRIREMRTELQTKSLTTDSRTNDNLRSSRYIRTINL